MIGISRIAKAAGKLVFMDEAFTKALEKELTSQKSIHGYKNLHRQLRDGFVKAEQTTQNQSLWKSIKSQITDLPRDLKSGWAAKGAWGKLKGVGGQLMRRLPLLFVAMEIPNIYSAFKDEGIVGGVKEVLKSGTRMAASMAGFAVGQALIPIPIVGGLIGAIATDWLVSKVTGKSHSEKKAEKEAALAQANNAEAQAQMLQQQLGNTTPQVNIPQATMNQQQLMALRNMLYGGGLTNPMDQDFMAMTSGINRLNYIC